MIRLITLAVIANLVQCLSSSPVNRGRSTTDYVPIDFATASRRNTMESSFSPAVAAVQEADVVRRILQQRSSRGRSKQLPEQSAFQVQVNNHNNNNTTMAAAATTTRIKSTRKSNTSAKRKDVNSVLATDLPYTSALAALKAYHTHHAHLTMPRKYLVPETDSYPVEWHGIDLAATVYDMKWWLRHVKERPDRVAELNQLGFVWERLQPEWNLILEALISYRTLYNDLLVPSKFVVPFGNEEWSRSTWGISLGKVVYRIRSRGDFLGCNNYGPKRRRQLDALGFVWDVQEHNFEIFCQALKMYAKNHVPLDTKQRTAALKVPSQFVIPHDSEDWPSTLWGYPLGVKCTAIRQKQIFVKNHPERLKILADLGFHAGGNDSLSWLEVVHAAAVYSQMHGRNLDVPQSFVVPKPPKKDETSGVTGSDDAWPWPGTFWIVLLGTKVSHPFFPNFFFLQPV